MSYEGKDYYIMEDQTVMVKDCYDMKHPEKAVWYAHVNETNGYDEDDVSTHTPKTKEVGFTDNWKVDHYGNKYAEKIIQYAPDNDEGNNPWTKLID